MNSGGEDSSPIAAIPTWLRLEHGRERIPTRRRGKPRPVSESDRLAQREGLPCGRSAGSGPIRSRSRTCRLGDLSCVRTAHVGAHHRSFDAEHDSQLPDRATREAHRPESIERTRDAEVASHELTTTFRDRSVRAASGQRCWLQRMSRSSRLARRSLRRTARSGCVLLASRGSRLR